MGWAAGTPLAGRPVDVVLVGSCTNARLSDLRLAAGILRGRRVHPRIRMLLVPGSEQGRREHAHLGIDAVVSAARALWLTLGCSLCTTLSQGLGCQAQECTRVW